MPSGEDFCFSAADQAKLQGVIEKLDKNTMPIRKAGAWIAEKLSRAKIRPRESRDGEMGLYLALESLVLASPVSARFGVDLKSLVA